MFTNIKTTDVTKEINSNSILTVEQIKSILLKHKQESYSNIRVGVHTRHIKKFDEAVSLITTGAPPTTMNVPSRISLGEGHSFDKHGKLLRKRKPITSYKIF